MSDARRDEQRRGRRRGYTPDEIQTMWRRRGRLWKLVAAVAGDRRAYGFFSVGARRGMWGRRGR